MTTLTIYIENIEPIDLEFAPFYADQERLTAMKSDLRAAMSKPESGLLVELNLRHPNTLTVKGSSIVGFKSITSI